MSLVTYFESYKVTTLPLDTKEAAVLEGHQMDAALVTNSVIQWQAVMDKKKKKTLMWH